jgi:predicted enzyme related to lactoylglutathione lyase
MGAETQLTDARAVAGTAIFSEQPGKLAAFYGMLLGLRFERRLHEDGRDHRITDLAGVHVEIKATRQHDGSPTPDWGTDDKPGVNATELSFEVDDAAAAYEYALKLGAEELQPVAELEWGTWGVLRDPDGNRLGLWSRAGATTTDNEQADEDA